MKAALSTIRTHNRSTRRERLDVDMNLTIDTRLIDMATEMSKEPI